MCALHEFRAIVQLKVLERGVTNSSTNRNAFVISQECVMEFLPFRHCLGRSPSVKNQRVGFHENNIKLFDY